MAAHAVDPKLHRVCVEQILNLGLDHLLTMRTTAVHLVSAYLHSKKSEIDIDDIENRVRLGCHGRLGDPQRFFGRYTARSRSTEHPTCSFDPSLLGCRVGVTREIRFALLKQFTGFFVLE